MCPEVGVQVSGPVRRGSVLTEGVDGAAVAVFADASPKTASADAAATRRKEKKEGRETEEFVCMILS